MELFPKVGLALVLNLAALTPIGAQTPPALPANPAGDATAGQPAAPASGQANPGRDYYLGPEDVLSVTVVNVPNVSMPQVTIMPDGTITLPILDAVAVAGKTTTDVKQILTERWRRYLVNPIVTVAVVQQRSESVHVFGFVSRTGKLDFRPGKRLLEALAESGGATPQGDLSQVTLMRKSGAKQTLNLARPEVAAGSDVDVTLESGDLIFVPERRTQVNIVGQIARPGSYDYKDDMRVLDALTLAGGVLETSDLNAATLIHDGKEQKLDLEALLRRGDLKSNAKLSPGDRILIPELVNRTYVFGAVGRPGYYLFKPGDRILDALNGAGGPMRDADMKRINRIRLEKGAAKPALTTVNMDLFFKKADITANLLLEPGDVVYVPNSKRTLGLPDILSAFTGIQTLSAVGRIFGF